MTKDKSTGCFLIASDNFVMEKAGCDFRDDMIRGARSGDNVAISAHNVPEKKGRK